MPEPRRRTMTEPLRIIYVIHNAYGVGGTVRTIINQANAMAARGHDVDVVSMWRARDSTFFPLHERVRLVPLVDARSPARKTPPGTDRERSEEHTSELQSRENLVCRLLLATKNSQR